MEENVALDSSKQKQFVKSIKGIKKLLKVTDKPKGSKKEATDGIKVGKVKKQKRKQRGLVYLSHIPHGFYEHQMTEYFKQFGVVTNVRVIRSKRTGMSKGHAFVEFKDPTVAEIVAETMNNYLMGKRLIKAALVPPEKQRRNAKRKHWNAQNNPGNILRQKMKKHHNEAKTEEQDLKIARRLLSNLSKTKQKLREMNIDYDFFMPVDIPEQLLNLVEVKKEENLKSTDMVKKETKSENKVKEEEAAKKKNKKDKRQPEAIEIKDENKQPQNQGNASVNKKSKKVQQTQKSDKAKTQKQCENALDKKSKKSKESIEIVSSKHNSVDTTKIDKNVVNKVSKDNKTAKQNKVSKEQEQKEKKLKDAGVKPPKDFIKIQNESGDESDSSMDFNSDEYEKMIEQGDSDVPSDSEGEESDEDLDEDVTSEEESVTDVPPPKKLKGPPMTKNQPMQSKKQKNKPNVNKQSVQPMKKAQKEANPSKKPKFEKKGIQKTLSKVIKKKK